MLAELEVQPVATRSNVQTRVDARQPLRRHTAHRCCLILSSQLDRQQMLADAAADGGWETLVWDAWESHRSLPQPGEFSLAIVDLQDCNLPVTEQLRQLSASQIARPGCLLIICGNQGDPQEELWARQLGAWLYLPGVSPDCDVATLCQQAHEVADRLAARTTTPAY